jgi:Ca2+-binding EF-hand superfamily protein
VQESGKEEFSYEEFRELIVMILGTLREKVKMSEDDIKTIFFIMDSQHRGMVAVQEMAVLKEGVENQLKEFYRSRINRDMVKVLLLRCRTPCSN